MVFHHKDMPPPILLKIIIDEDNLWITAEAKQLEKIISHENCIMPPIRLL